MDPLEICIGTEAEHFYLDILHLLLHISNQF